MVNKLWKDCSRSEAIETAKEGLGIRVNPNADPIPRVFRNISAKAIRQV